MILPQSKTSSSPTSLHSKTKETSTKKVSRGLSIILDTSFKCTKPWKKIFTVNTLMKNFSTSPKSFTTSRRFTSCRAWPKWSANERHQPTLKSLRLLFWISITAGIRKMSKAVKKERKNSTVLFHSTSSNSASSWNSVCKLSNTSTWVTVT